jgi:RDD family
MVFTGIQDGSRLYEHDFTVQTAQTEVLPKNAFQAGLKVLIRQSGSAVHIEAWMAFGPGFGGLRANEMGIAPGGLNALQDRSEARARVNPLLAELGQPPISQPPVHVGPGLKPAGLLIRFVAITVDVVVTFMILVAFEDLAEATGYNPVTAGGDPPGNFIFPLGLIVTLIWIPVCWRLLGGTPAQRLLGMSLVSSDDGARINAATVFLRYLLWLVCVGTLIPGLAIAYLARRDPYGRSWLDRVTMTMVVKKTAAPAEQITALPGSNTPPA